MKEGEVLIILIILLLAIVIIFIMVWDSYKMDQRIANENTDNVIIENNSINFNSLTLKQKIAQMIIVRGDGYDKDFVKLNIGGIHLDRQNSEESYKGCIENYQSNSRIKLFVTTDLEGAWNPFRRLGEEYSFPTISEIETKEEAYNLGLRHGKILKELGFNLNFAPVSEFEDKVYGGRVFSGTKEEVKEKLEGYILGLQENVLGTCKHYPGKGMIKNIHWSSDRQEISKEDLGLFEDCIKNNISAIMVGHQIVSGELDSDKKPSSVSKEIISNLPERVLIISDEINMLGLRMFYFFNKRKMYKDLINSGENIILDFSVTPKSVYSLIEKLEKEVEKGEINEDTINKSVRKILLAKGYFLD